MSYYNERNGWVDNGKKLNNRKCPNCKSSNFRETLSREYCPDCKLECDYWVAVLMKSTIECVNASGQQNVNNRKQKFVSITKNITEIGATIEEKQNG